MFITGIIMRSGAQRVAVLKHHIRLRREFPGIGHGDECQVRYKRIAIRDFIQNRIRDGNMPKHTLRIGVYPQADANSGIIRDILCCQIQGESDEVPVQPLQPFALARTENNEVLHKVCL